MGRKIVRVLLGLLYFAAGVLHLAAPAPFIGITPSWVPNPPLVIMLPWMKFAGAGLMPWYLTVMGFAILLNSGYSIATPIDFVLELIGP